MKHRMHDRPMTEDDAYEAGLSAGRDLRTTWTYGWRHWPALCDHLQYVFRQGWLDGRDTRMGE